MTRFSTGVSEVMEGGIGVERRRMVSGVEEGRVALQVEGIGLRGREGRGEG